MTPGASKKPFQCPSCGFVQLESPHLISTYCRACGDYYEVSRPGAMRTPPAPRPSIPVAADRGRSIFCHRCGTTHAVSQHARSTICPGCSSAIDLVDLEFLQFSSRPVDTRGHVFVGPSGALSSSWMICGSARIEGRISGPLRSEGEVVFATQELSLVSKVIAPTVMIEKGARTSLTMPLETDHLIVRGSFSGVVRCRGIVHVMRGGDLNAEVLARSVVVDKGGVFSGQCQIHNSGPLGKETPPQTASPQTVFSPLMVPRAGNA